MTAALQEREKPQKIAQHIWKMMSIGPLVFLFWLLAIGLFLLYVSYADGSKEALGAAEETPPGAMAVEIALWLAPLSVIVSEIIGVRAAYARRDALAKTPFESHAVSAIRTFWIMVWGFAATLCLSFMLLAIPNIGAVGFGVGMVFIMLAAVPLLFVWNGVRVFRGWRRACEGKPVSDDPTRWA